MLHLKRHLPKWGKFLLVLTITFIIVFGFMLFTQTLIAHRPGTSFTPDYPKLDLSALLAQDTLTDSDYDTLFLQTGLGRSAADILLSAGQTGRAAIRQIQDSFFAHYSITCDPLLGWFTREDHLQSSAGDTVYTPELVDLQPGDLLITLSTHSLGWRHGHAGLVVDTGDGLGTLECVVLGTDSKVMALDHWRTYSNLAVLRVKGLDEQERAASAEYAMEHLVGIPYHLTAGFFGPKAPEPDSPGFGLQCSYLVWYAWQAAGYDLDSDGGPLASSYDLLHSDLLEVVQLYGMDPRLFDQ